MCAVRSAWRCCVCREMRWRKRPTERMGATNAGRMMTARSASCALSAKMTASVAATVTAFVTMPTSVPVTAFWTAPTSLLTRDMICPVCVVT